MTPKVIANFLVFTKGKSYSNAIKMRSALSYYYQFTLKRQSVWDYSTDAGNLTLSLDVRTIMKAIKGGYLGQNTGSGITRLLLTVGDLAGKL